MPLPYYFDYSRFEISFKIRKCEKSKFILFFFFLRSFWLVRSLQIPREFYYGFFYICKIMSLNFALILDAFNHCVKLSFYPPLSEDFHGFPTSWRWYFIRIFHFSCHTRKLKERFISGSYHRMRWIEWLYRAAVPHMGTWGSRLPSYYSLTVKDTRALSLPQQRKSKM